MTTTHQIDIFIHSKLTYLYMNKYEKLMKVPVNVDLKPVDKFSQTMFNWDMPG
jgi:hypothetical protein